MLIYFFDCLKKHQVPVSLTELLDLINGLDKQLVFADQDAFYHFSRCCLVKDEKHFDKFDRAFKAFFDGLQSVEGMLEALIPDDWLRSEITKQLTDEQKDKVKSIDDLNKLIEEFKKRLEEQKERHEGGNKWIGTGGTSPFGHSGYHPNGMRVGGAGGNRQAAKIWERRDFKNLDNDAQISARNIQIALRRLRKFARTGAEDQLDINDTISSTAKNAGMLDIKMVPERHNAVKVLVFFDVGGSMDYHVKAVQELFNAVRTEFKHLEFYYFHNFIYESVWKDNLRRHDERIPIGEILNKYSRDYKVIFVGDAAMSPYEVMQPGGSIEHWNEEAGSVWMKRLLSSYDKAAWINPEAEDGWKYTQSTQLIRDLLEDRMYPLTVNGLEKSMANLTK
jgi:uncharacterized protein with von Willebrand factor type A (vWA) domain